MRKLMMTLMAVTFAIAANAQGYNVGTSSRYNDGYGNSISTHRNQYGMTTGTSSSYNDETQQPPIGISMARPSARRRPMMTATGTRRPLITTLTAIPRVLPKAIRMTLETLPPRIPIHTEGH